MCDPRELLDQLLAIARYKMLRPEMTPELIDLAAGRYFVSLGSVSDDAAPACAFTQGP